MAPVDVPADPNGHTERVSASAKLLYGLLGLVLAGYAISLIVRHNGSTTTLVDGWGVATFEMAASLLVVLRALMSRRDRAFGLWLGLGMCAWAAGDYAMTIETLHGATPATLSVANVLWYGFFPLAYIGVMVLMRRDVRRFTVANYLDGVVATLVTCAVFWAFAFHAIVKASGGDTAGAAVNVIYPIGDLLLLALCAIPIKLLPKGKRTRWYLMAAACLANAFGDVAALFPGLVAAHAGFFFNAVAWPASLYLISSAIWLAPSTTDAVQEETSNAFVIPAVAGALALVVLFVGSLNHSSQAAIGLASATLLAAGVRFGLALRRLNGLTEERHRQLAEAAEAERESREALQRTVREYSDFATRVADGDLTAKVAASGDAELQELAGSLNRMVAGLAEISSEIQTGVQDMGSSTADILSAVNDHTENAGTQSAAIQQTSATVDELRAASDAISQKADEVAKRARASLDVSDEGSAAVAAISDAMRDIRERVDGIAQDITTLSERTQQIGEITETVNGLADRSNLLALNASIEAARAGEHGKGFAVVADQVRHLAEQSKAATAQVESILRDIQSATETAVQVSAQGSQVVLKGLELADRAGDGIRSLSDTIRAASESAEDIAASVQQQSAGMMQIASAMQEISAGTGHFVEGARQSQQAAENLGELSGKLAGLTERYRVG
jgi:methyl-accepting chemotaxis protein